MTLEEKKNRKMKSLYVQGMSYLLTQPTLTQNINLHSIFKALPISALDTEAALAIHLLQ